MTVVQIHKRPNPSVMTDAEIWRRELERGPRRPWFVALRHLLSSWRK